MLELSERATILSHRLCRDNLSEILSHKFVPIQKIKREFRRETRDVLHSANHFSLSRSEDPEDHERAKLCKFVKMRFRI